MSQAEIKSTPAPMHAPWTAAITGFGHCRTIQCYTSSFYTTFQNLEYFFKIRLKFKDEMMSFIRTSHDDDKHLYTPAVSFLRFYASL